MILIFIVVSVSLGTDGTRQYFPVGKRIKLGTISDSLVMTITPSNGITFVHHLILTTKCVKIILETYPITAVLVLAEE